MKGISGDNKGSWRLYDKPARRVSKKNASKRFVSKKKKKDYSKLVKELTVVNDLKAIAERRNPDNVANRLEKYSQRNIFNMNIPEKQFRDKLELGKIKFIAQKVYQDGSYGYIVDFYLPEFNTCVEIDGGYHDDPKQQIKDAYKDRYLISLGLKVLRIKTNEVKGLKLKALLKRLRSMKAPATFFI